MATTDAVAADEKGEEEEEERLKCSHFVFSSPLPRWVESSDKGGGVMVWNDDVVDENADEEGNADGGSDCGSRCSSLERTSQKVFDSSPFNTNDSQQHHQNRDHQHHQVGYHRHHKSD